MEVNSWVPQEEATAKICGLFSEYQHPGSNQSQVLAQLERCRAFPDFNNYLALILAQGTSLQLEIRQSAGLLLKNNLKQQYAGTPAVYQDFIKSSLLLAISNDAKPLRQVVGTNIATVVAASGGVPAWPQLLPALASCLESDSLPAVEGALDALFKIFEEAPSALDSGQPGVGDGVVGVLVPRVLALFCSPAPDIKTRAVSIMNLLAAGAAPGALSAVMETYRLGLFSLARDAAAPVRRAVCTGLVQLLHLQPESLLSQMHDIIEYMLESSQDSDQALALESCEFWAALCDSTLDTALLAPYLPRLVPLLLRNMIYEEFDEEVVDTEAAEAGIPSAADHDADVRPFHHRNSEEGLGKDSASWNLRKSSAAGLDVLSNVFGEELLQFVTPTVRERLQDPDWRARESAILALGAISEGCHAGLVPYIGELVGLLIPRLADARPLVRSITCWTLSRYSHWVVANGQDPHSPGQLQFDLVIEGLLGRVLDHNKHVQEAACSALATLEEQAGPELLPRLKTILETLAQATLVYGRRNVRMLYDALSTLAEAVGRTLAEPSFLILFMPSLLTKWAALGDADAELLPLLECFMTIATAIGPAFEQYAETTFQRCMRVLTARLASKQLPRSPSVAGIETDADVDLDFIVCALDTLSGVAEALGSRFEALLSLNSSAFGLRDILLQCCQDASPDIRQSAFALVGDLAKVCAPYLTASLTELIALSIANLEGRAISQATMSACNNACWSLGELAIKQRPEELAPFAAPVVERLVPILGAVVGQMPRSLIENAAITLGRVAWVCPQQVAPHLEHFLAPWCAALRLLNDGVEKEHAFQGLCASVRRNPQAAAASFKSIVEAALSWQTLHNDSLRADLLQILQLHKAELVERGQWQPYLASLSPGAREKMLAMLQHVS